MKIRPVVLALLFALPLASCNEHQFFPKNNSMVRHVRFAPTLLNRTSLLADTTAAHAPLFQVAGSSYNQKVVAGFKGTLAPQELQNLLQLEYVKAIGPPLGTGFPVLYTLELREGLNEAQVALVITALQQRPEVTYAAPFLRNGSGIAGVTDELFVKLTHTSRLPQLEQQLRLTGAAIVRQLNETTFVLRVDKHTKKSGLELALYLEDLEGVDTAAAVLIPVAMD